MGTGATDQPMLGPYRLVEELGAGAMGTVWHADEGGREVALKLIHPHLLGRRGFFQRFQREARAGRKVDHPNVVRTLECDLLFVDGEPRPFLVMEYVEGRTLRELLDDLGTVPETLVREIARQVAAGLEAIHAAGLVHRDLKPDNVLITNDHKVRIMDLGIAKELEASMTLTQEGQFAGSLLYASPEQIRHEDVGPSADLYALGVTLYELATGRNPFRYDEVAAVMHAHLEETPPSPGEVSPDLSAFIAELVSTLLSKSTANRIESAGVLREILEQGEEAAWWVARDRQLREAGPTFPPILVRRETKLHGRKGDLALLASSWASARGGEGNTLLLEGEAGIGKTRVIDAFLRTLDRRDAHVLYGSYPPTGGAGGLSDAVLEHFGRADFERAVEPYLHELPSLVPVLSAVLRRDDLPAGAKPLQGDVLNAVFVHLMRALAQERPLLWIVEDLHFASLESRQVVLSLARALRGHRVLLLVTTRPGLREEELANFSRLESFRRTTLGRLSPREVVELLRDAFQSDALAEKLGVKIAHQSDGVPFFVFEMLRGLREGQFITQLPDGSYIESKIIDEIQVPSAVKDLIEVRLKDLSKDERGIIDLGAVLGFEFNPDLLARVRKRDRLDILEAIAHIERATGIVRDTGRGYRFDHHQIQEVVYQAVPAGLRAEYHSRSATTLAQDLQAEPRGEHHYQFARHHLLGRTPMLCQPSLLPALDHLTSSRQDEEAIRLARMALETPELFADVERATVLSKKGDCHSRRGETELAREDLDAACTAAEAAGDLGLQARTRLALASHLKATSAWDASLLESDAAFRLALELGDRRLEVQALLGRGNALSGQGRRAEASEQTTCALRLAEALGDRASQAAATVNLGIDAFRGGEYAEAEVLFERGIRLAQEAGHRTWEANARYNFASMLAEGNRPEEARSHFESVVAEARREGNRVRERQALGRLGSTLAYLGEYEEAETLLRRARSLAREMGHREGEVISASSLAELFLRRGRYEDARREAEKTLALAQEFGSTSRVYVLGLLGVVLDRLGCKDEARSRLEEGLQAAREAGMHDMEAFALANLGCHLSDAGHAEEAAEHLESAVSLARKFGVLRAEIIAVGALSNAQLRMGHLEESLVSARRHRELAQETRDPTRELAALCIEAHALEFLGALDEALDRREEWLARARQRGDREQEARALEGCARVEASRGNEERADQLRQRALVVFRETNGGMWLANCLLSMAHSATMKGEMDEAARYRNEALQIAEELDMPDVQLLATVDEAPIKESGADDLIAALEQYEHTASWQSLMEAHKAAFQLTGDRVHIEKAKSLLDHLVEHAPEEYRESMLKNVQLNREIESAWKALHPERAQRVRGLNQPEGNAG